MARFSTALALLSIASVATAFSPAAPCLGGAAPKTALFAVRTRSANAQDQPRAVPGWTYADDFDAPVLADPQSGTAVLAGQPLVDDECYMGKEGDAADCVDFDPPRTRSANAQDQPRAVPGWTYADDFDAPVLADPQSGTAVLTGEPIVDDECYMGKEGDATDCVDFDPPRTRSANAQDQPRSAPSWTYADDFDAPVLADPQSGTAVLAGEPIVDDECYMGKEGDATECVDFDPVNFTPRENSWTNAADAPRGPRKGLSKLL